MSFQQQQIQLLETQKRNYSSHFEDRMAKNADLVTQNKTNRQSQKPRTDLIFTDRIRESIAMPVRSETTTTTKITSIYQHPGEVQNKEEYFRCSMQPVQDAKTFTLVQTNNERHTDRIPIDLSDIKPPKLDIFQKSGTQLRKTVEMSIDREYNKLNTSRLSFNSNTFRSPVKREEDTLHQSTAFSSSSGFLSQKRGSLQSPLMTEKPNQIGINNQNVYSLSYSNRSVDASPIPQTEIIQEQVQQIIQNIKFEAKSNIPFSQNSKFFYEPIQIYSDKHPNQISSFQNKQISNIPDSSQPGESAGGENTFLSSANQDQTQSNIDEFFQFDIYQRDVSQDFFGRNSVTSGSQLGKGFGSIEPSRESFNSIGSGDPLEQQIQTGENEQIQEALSSLQTHIQKNVKPKVSRIQLEPPSKDKLKSTDVNSISHNQSKNINNPTNNSINNNEQFSDIPYQISESICSLENQLNKLIDEKNQDLSKKIGSDELLEPPSPSKIRKTSNCSADSTRILSQESSILLKDIYQDVQSTLMKYDSIIKENELNRTKKGLDSSSTFHGSPLKISQIQMQQDTLQDRVSKDNCEQSPHFQQLGVRIPQQQSIPSPQPQQNKKNIDLDDFQKTNLQVSNTTKQPPIRNTLFKQNSIGSNHDNTDLGIFSSSQKSKDLHFFDTESLILQDFSPVASLFNNIESQSLIDNFKTPNSLQVKSPPPIKDIKEQTVATYSKMDEKQASQAFKKRKNEILQSLKKIGLNQKQNTKTTPNQRDSQIKQPNPILRNSSCSSQNLSLSSTNFANSVRSSKLLEQSNLHINLENINNQVSFPQSSRDSFPRGETAINNIFLKSNRSSLEKDQPYAIPIARQPVSSQKQQNTRQSQQKLDISKKRDLSTESGGIKSDVQLNFSNNQKLHLFDSNNEDYSVSGSYNFLVKPFRISGSIQDFDPELYQNNQYFFTDRKSPKSNSKSKSGNSISSPDQQNISKQTGIAKSQSQGDLQGDCRLSTQNEHYESYTERNKITTEKMNLNQNISTSIYAGPSSNAQEQHIFFIAGEGKSRQVSAHERSQKQGNFSSHTSTLTNTAEQTQNAFNQQPESINSSRNSSSKPITFQIDLQQLATQNLQKKKKNLHKRSSTATLCSNENSNFEPTNSETSKKTSDIAIHFNRIYLSSQETEESVKNQRNSVTLAKPCFSQKSIFEKTQSKELKFNKKTTPNSPTGPSLPQDVERLPVDQQYLKLPICLSPTQNLENKQEICEIIKILEGFTKNQSQTEMKEK